MAEIKVNKDLVTDIIALNTAANGINSSYTAIDVDEVDSLDTVKKLMEQDKSIKKLMGLYEQLLKKEVRDLQDMVTTMEKMDYTTGKSYKA